MPEFATVAYVNKYTKRAERLPSEDFTDGKCTLLSKKLLSQFRSEEDDAKAKELREACIREAEVHENMYNVASCEETQQKAHMRWLYAMSCIAQMNL